MGTGMGRVLQPKVEQLHPEKKTSLDDKLNKLMYDTVNRMATEISNATSVLLLK